jgi:hypothetical protein
VAARWKSIQFLELNASLGIAEFETSIVTGRNRPQVGWLVTGAEFLQIVILLECAVCLGVFAPLATLPKVASELLQFMHASFPLNANKNFSGV